MHAVEEGKEFDLLARRTGEVIEADRRAQADAQHGARPPGSAPTPASSTTAPSTTGTPVQNQDRISASNPCSEYMQPGQLLAATWPASTCSSSSGTTTPFDAERFAKVTELIITAMDISISFADFPTEKIAETTRAYRQLGIGYANLGALLMATGHAYDSEGGRAHRRRDHLADDRGRLQDARPSSPRSSARTTATRATPSRTSGSSASTRTPASRSARSARSIARSSTWPARPGRSASKRARANGYRNAQASPTRADRVPDARTPWSRPIAD